MTTFKLVHPASFLVAALIGLTVGACAGDSELRVETVCKRHCNRAVDCNGIVEYDNCVSNCVETSDDCDSDADVEMALDKLDTCPDKVCSEVLGCATEAWVECTF